MKKVHRNSRQIDTTGILPGATPEEVKAEAVQLLQRLVDLQKTLPGAKPGEHMSNSKFAEGYCSMDGSSYGRVVASLIHGDESKYNVDDWRPMIQRFRGALSILEARIENVTATDGPLEFPSHVNVYNAIRAALTQPRDRLIPVLGETGAGKTQLRHLLEQTFPTQVLSVSASRPWQSRYAPLFRTLAKALGISKCPRAAYDIQETVTTMLAAGQKILVIDESQYLGLPSLDGIKWLCEKTNCVLVLLTTPTQWRHVEAKDYDDVAQLENRIFAKIYLCMEKGKPFMPRGEVSEFVRQHLPQFEQLTKDEQKEVANYVAAQGESFGLWNKVTALCDQVSTFANPRGLKSEPLPISLRSFQTAAANLTTMGRN